jgi:ribonuclease T2
MGPSRHLFRPIGARLFRDRAQGAGAVKIPPEFTDLKEPLSVTPHEVEEAFIKANPGLSADAMAIGCDAKRLTEVRLCLSKDLRFRDCAEIAKRSCCREQLTMPPVRGG